MVTGSRSRWHSVWIGSDLSGRIVGEALTAHLPSGLAAMLREFRRASGLPDPLSELERKVTPLGSTPDKTQGEKAIPPYVRETP